MDGCGWIGRRTDEESLGFVFALLMDLTKKLIRGWLFWTGRNRMVSEPGRLLFCYPCLSTGGYDRMVERRRRWLQSTTAGFSQQFLFWLCGFYHHQAALLPGFIPSPVFLLLGFLSYSISYALLRFERGLCWDDTAHGLMHLQKKREMAVGICLRALVSIYCYRFVFRRGPRED